MSGTLVGLRFAGAVPAERCSEYMKRTLAALVGECGITYNMILFPYADTLLLSEQDKRGNFFGTHAVLCGVSAQQLARAAASACGDMLPRLDPRAVRLECTREALRAFLDTGAGGDERCLYGGIAELTGGRLRPWNIREAARDLCSFCEQAVRMDGVEISGLVGGSVCARVAPEAVEAFAALYTAKTGGNAAH